MRNIRTLTVLGILLLAGSTVAGATQKQQNSPKGADSVRQATQQKQHASQHKVQDANGDGLCDVCKNSVSSGQKNAQGQKANKGKHWGPGDGSGQKENPPKDGTGYGANSGKGNGPQDGSGNRDGSGMQRGGQGQGGTPPGNGGSKGRGTGRGRN